MFKLKNTFFIQKSRYLIVVPLIIGAISVGSKRYMSEDNLPTFTKEQIITHNNVNDRIWVTYKDGVYDITDFVENHPGGKSKIMLAAGSSIDPFWAIYAAHDKPEVLEILKQMKIGNYKRSEVEKNINDPYSTDPERHPALITRVNKPYNAETPKPLLLEYLTPNDFFYVRNHLPVPKVNLNEYKIVVCEEGTPKKEFTIEDIKNFPKVTITSTLQCSGQRRSELINIKPIQGINWDIGATSNAIFSGARLSDVLSSVGINRESIVNPNYQHVQFEGLDHDTERNYGASIPVKKAIDLDGDVLLAYEMNGVELPVDHGFPLRVVVPGHTGARSVKWLSKINISKEESHAFWQRRDYKGFGPNTEWADADFDKAESIQEIPVNSAIVEPAHGDIIEDDGITVRGFAISGGGRAIIRVDISPDGGNTWKTAELIPNGQPHNKSWSWTQFKCDIPVTSEMKGNNIQICSKAVNSSYDVQPDGTNSLWNIRGVLNNAWHRVTVKISNE